MAKYNAALDKLILAAAMHLKGDIKQAAALFAEAAAHKSIASAQELVNNYNKKAIASIVKPVTKPVKASAWPWQETAAAGSDVLDTQNDEFGVEPDENDLMSREVQEADAEDGDGDEDDLEVESPAEVARARFERALANLAKKG